MKSYIFLFLKGLGMGAANVIPGVSGGTIALITGIFEKLIHSIKAFDLVALKLIFNGRFLAFSRKVNLDFLVAVFLGIGVSIVSLARILGYLFAYYPLYVWAYFFGLILASVFYVSRTVKRWNVAVVLFFLAGSLVAIGVSFLAPATPNENFFYLFVSGIVALCSMILPGLSGSYVLVLMGEYELVMIQAVNEFRLDILLPVILGGVFGLIAFAHLLSWVFKHFRDQTIALLGGFILGSLATIWPWKAEVYVTDSLGNIIRKSGGEPIVQGYHWFFPDSLNITVIVSVILIATGVLTIILTEGLANKQNKGP